MSAANATWRLELFWSAKRGEAAGREFDLFVVRTSLEVIAVDCRASARSRARRGASTGKVGHPAGLNFGDCFAYALAQVGRRTAIVQRGAILHANRHRSLLRFHKQLMSLTL